MEKRRVLFVDDEPNVIDGLRRMLRRQRTQWDMEFVSDAAAALAKMAACPFDVVITDLKMPGMDGAELLERVMKHYPATARIVLSGHADEAVTRRALTAAHRFLAKPADADKLVATVADACAACQIVGDDRLRALVGGVTRCPVRRHCIWNSAVRWSPTRPTPVRSPISSAAIWPWPRRSCNW